MTPVNNPARARRHNGREVAQDKTKSDGREPVRIAFLVNPVAGMGGRVGLKGTDGMAEEAIRRGASPVAPVRALEAVASFAERIGRDANGRVRWLTCSGAMGAEVLDAAGIYCYDVVFEAPPATGAADTRAAAGRFLEAGADLILFCGGDGTARDICQVTDLECPLLGIPSGVKMYSGVFGVTPARTGEIVAAYVRGELAPAEVEILDLDEERYRRGEWVVRLYQSALTPYEPSWTQAAKVLVPAGVDDDARRDIADYLLEEIMAAPGVMVVLGPGGTVKAIADVLGIDKTLLGIDAVVDDVLVGADLDEHGLLGLLDEYPDARLVLSPIGAQGFLVGRGNLPLSPRVLRRIGVNNLVVVATPAKLARTGPLRFDSGDAALDAELAGAGYLSVVVGYRRRRMVQVAR